MILLLFPFCLRSFFNPFSDFLPSSRVALIDEKRFAQSCRKVICRPVADERLDPEQEVRLLRREAADMKSSLMVCARVVISISDRKFLS